MQVAGGHKTLALCLDFTPSIALYIWQSFSKPRQAVQHSDDVMGVWMCVSEVCCTRGCIGASVEKSVSTLLALSAVDPLQTIPTDTLLYDNLSSPPALLMLSQVELVIRNVLLFAQLLATAASNRNALVAPLMRAGTTIDEVMAVLHHAITTTLEQPTEFSCCTPVLQADPTPHDGTSTAPQPQTQPCTQPHVTILRSLVLFLKLATLTFNVKADLRGHVETPLLVQSLWDIVFLLAGGLLADRTVEEDDGVSWVHLFASQQEHTLCVLLCEHAVATLRQALKEPQAELPRKSCLRLLVVVTGLMPEELLRPEVEKLGRDELPGVLNQDSHTIYPVEGLRLCFTAMPKAC